MEIPSSVFGVSKIALRESTRYAVNYIRLESDQYGRCRAVATDGRRLLLCDFYDQAEVPPAPPGSGDPAKSRNVLMVPATIWDACIKGRRRSEDIGTISVSKQGDVVTASRCEDGITRSFSQKLEDCEKKFPDYAQVIPTYKKDDCVQFSVNPSLLAGLLEAMKDPEGVYGDHCVLTIPKNGLRPLRIDRAADGIRQTAVLLPTKDDHGGLPAYHVEALTPAPALVEDETAVKAAAAPSEPESTSNA